MTQIERPGYRAFRSLSVLVSLSFASLMAALIGCSGEDGPAGRDGTSVDAMPPTVALVTPVSGSTLPDTFTVSARAIDNAGVERVMFYIDGSDAINDSTVAHDTSAASASNPLYTWTYLRDNLGLEEGPHTIVARARDLNHNVASTPPVIVYTERSVLPGPAVLKHWSPDSLARLQFPTRDINNDEVLDTLYNVRFDVERDCIIDSVRLYLDSIPGVNMVYDRPLRLGVHHSDGVFPKDTITTALLNVVDLDTARFFSLGFEQQVAFGEGDRFHVSFSVEEPTDTTLMAAGVSVVERYPFDLDNYSGFYQLDDSFPGWTSFQAARPEEMYTFELMLEVHVTYLE